MKTCRHIPLLTVILLMLTVAISCGETAPTYEVRLLDSLNSRAYSYQYRNIDSSFQAAFEAYQESNLYGQGKAEACNNLGFCAFMQMDFDAAIRFYKEVYESTVNELELLIADVGLMKVYQRTAMNKEYYDSRNSAIRRMKRIQEDISLFVDEHEVKRLNYARSEFYIVSAIYYHYLQQESEAIASMNEIDENDILASDTNQFLYYHYIKGASGLCQAASPDERVIKEFDELYTCWKVATGGDYLYFEANSLQGIAELLNVKKKESLLWEHRMRALTALQINYQLSDTTLTLGLAQKALTQFEQYGDIYQIAGAYVTIGKFYNTNNQYAEALSSLKKALDCVNYHHRNHYTHSSDSIDVLQSYSPKDTITTELVWIAKEGIKTVPEWIGRIREQLSVSYAGLGLKLPSNYNRNAYLDILDFTRQDKELESRYQALESENRQLNAISFFFVIGLLLLILLFGIFNSRSKVRNKRYTERLKRTLELCQKIPASIPSDASNEQEIVDYVSAAILPDLDVLFGAVKLDIVLNTEDNENELSNYCELKSIDVEFNNTKCIKSDFNMIVPDKTIPIGTLHLFTSHKLTKDEAALMNVIIPYIAWTIDNGMTLISLGDEKRQLEKQRYIFEQHIWESKRQNLVKKACLAIVNGINPYMDRVINEVDKLIQKRYIDDDTLKKEKYQYIDELITTINEYNDILALWIKTKQGSLNLCVENFDLQELFDLLSKGRKAFEMKQQTLEVGAADFIVKADKSLTLFMINTLMENARKYTQPGGKVSLYAQQTDDYVEISIEDNGRGLTSDDVERILGEKVYESGTIGIHSPQDAEELKESKGSGFGLMNCKGIIEKYRKTNDLFRVCSFNIDSVSGKGSRFYFRLPIGIKKALLFIPLLLLFSISGRAASSNVPLHAVQAEESDAARLLDEASYFADTAYYCNVMEEYSVALQYVDSALSRLNEHYQRFSNNSKLRMGRIGIGNPAEIFWWSHSFPSDYHVILDVRNEAAVACLALNQWEEYRYNNDAYSTLYKLLGEDNSLEEYCRQLEHSTNNKIVGVLLCIVMLLVLIIGYYFMYVRKRYLNRLNLEQILEINRQVFSASMMHKNAQNPTEEESRIKEIPQYIVDESFDAVNELLIIDRMAIAVFNDETQTLEYVYNHRREIPKELSMEIVRNEEEELRLQMAACYHAKSYLHHPSIQCMPLLVDVGESHRCVGVLAFAKQEEVPQEESKLLFELIVRYVAIAVFNSVVKPANQYRNIESAQDETRRASWEEGLLHVQNMVLDNCLSTIKHETIYYPNKIKQIIDKLNRNELQLEEEREHIEAISELIAYYKGVFTTLSLCAARQLEEVTFRRGTLSAQHLIAYATKYLSKANRKIQVPVELCSGESNLLISGDETQLRFLIESLIDESLTCTLPGKLMLDVIPDGEYVCFRFTDTRRERTVEELNHLFYPNLLRMHMNDEGNVTGTEYLICKQIVRDHDEFAGRRGCRINAEPNPCGGFTVYFTIPKK